MPLLKELVLASSNPGKLDELSHLFAQHGVRLFSQSELGVVSGEEPFGTFVENALAKARNASGATGKPALGDDSGLCVSALEGRPGVHSARWAGEEGGGVLSDRANNDRLIRELNGHLDRSAFYYCVLVLVRSENDPQPVIADGVWVGQITDAPRGKSGFGYDPYFLPAGLGLTCAEMDLASKNRLSHRFNAMRALVEKLADNHLLPVRRPSLS